MDNKQFKNNKEREKFLDEKLDELAEKQENDILIDFDAIIEEEKAEALNIKFNNKIYKIPYKMPFSFAMFFFRNCLKTVKGVSQIQVPDELTLDFIEKMFGSEFLKDLEKSKSGFSFNLIFEQFTFKILEKWGLDLNSPDVEKKMAQMQRQMKNQ